MTLILEPVASTYKAELMHRGSVPHLEYLSGLWNCYGNSSFLMFFFSLHSSILAQLVKNLPASAGDAGDVGLNPGLGQSPGEGNGNLLQYSFLENSMGGGLWGAKVHGVTKSWTWLSDFNYILYRPGHVQDICYEYFGILYIIMKSPFRYPRTDLA